MKRLFVYIICVTCALTLVSCGGKGSKKSEASNDGKVDIEKVAKKLEKEAFEGEKYSKEAVQDYNGEAKMEIKAKKPVKQLFGSKVDVSAGVDVAFADSEHSSSSIAECNIKTSALFMNDSMSMTSYLDKET